MNRQPTLFLSHGSPLHAVQPGVAGTAWATLGKTLPRPRAVLIVSAHWETSVPMLTGNPQPATLSAAVPRSSTSSGTRRRGRPSWRRKPSRC